MSNGSSPSSDPARHALERVAASLGCTVEALHSEEGLPAELVNLDELLGHWAALRTDEQRQRVLHAAREAVQDVAACPIDPTGRTGA